MRGETRWRILNPVQYDPGVNTETIGGPRRRLADALIVLLVGGSLLAVVRNVDRYWPFRTYPMFASAVRSPALVSYLLEGVTARGERVSLMRNSALSPLDPARVTSAMRALRPDPDRRRRALEDLLDRYNRKVRAGSLAGPPLVAVRLYGAGWRLDGPGFAPELSPDWEFLLAEAGVRPGP